MSFRLVEPSARWQRGRMAQELSALPESFAAGTTVKYRRRLSDYPRAPAGRSSSISRARACSSRRRPWTATTSSSHSRPLTPTATSQPGLQVGRAVSNAGGEVYEVDVAPSRCSEPRRSHGRKASRSGWSGQSPRSRLTSRTAPRRDGELPDRRPRRREDADQGGGGATRHIRVAPRAAQEPDFVTRPVLVSFTKPGFER